MLQQEPEHETPPVQAVPPAQRRVTADELNAALNALESRKQEEAKRGRETVEIGAVVQELGLDLTPEEIWQQVQAQRAEQSAPPSAASPKLAETVNETLHTAAQQAHKIAGQASAAVAATYVAAQAAHPRKQKRRGKIGVALTLFAIAGIALNVFSGGHSLTVAGDHDTHTYFGHYKSAVAAGDYDNLTFNGDTDTLTVLGDHDRITVTGTVKHIVMLGDNNIIQWTQEPGGRSPAISDIGDGNRIARAATATP